MGSAPTRVGRMSFTELDRIKECVLGALFAECGREGPPNDRVRAGLCSLLDSWEVEGPERFRLEQLLETPVDGFQLRVYRSELESTLLLRSCRRAMIALLRNIERSVSLKSLSIAALRLRHILLSVRSNSSILHRAVRVNSSALRGA